MSFLFLYLATGARLLNPAKFHSASKLLVRSPLSCSVVNNVSSRYSLSKRRHNLYQLIDQTHQQRQCILSALSSLTNQMLVEQCWNMAVMNDIVIPCSSIKKIKIQMSKYFKNLFL